MFKQIILALGALVAVTAFAAVDINKASQAELEAVKGIGPSMAAKILSERQKAPFKDWNDVIERVKGVGGHGATRFSSGGLTVDGAAYTGAAASKAGAKSRKKADGKSAAATAAAGARKK